MFVCFFTTVCLNSLVTTASCGPVDGAGEKGGFWGKSTFLLLGQLAPICTLLSGSPQFCHCLPAPSLLLSKALLSTSFLSAQSLSCPRWDKTAASQTLLNSRSHRLYKQAFPFTQRQVLGNCLPTNPLEGSEDPGGAEIEVLERVVVP